MKRGKIIYTIPGVLLGVTLIFGAILASLRAKADTVVDTVTVTVPESCTLSTPSGEGETYTVSMNGGQYKNDIGPTTISIFCNSNDSLAVYAVGYSNLEFGNTEMIAGATGATNISTGTATAGSASAWAMKIAATAGTGSFATPSVISPFNDFTSVPTSYAKVAEANAATSGVTNEAEITATYAVYISPNQAPGAYTGKVLYTVVHPASEVPLQPQTCEAGKICYFPNASGVVDSMGDQTQTYDADNDEYIDIASSSEAQLWASNFKREGYGFAGWNTKFDYSGTTYGPNEIITTPANLDTEGLSLYAYWVKSVGNLQDWNGCSALSVGDVTALTDTRDSDTYAVAKLADGKCWMIENLRLGGSSAITLTSSSSDIASSFTLAVSTDPATWCIDEIAACIDQSMLNATNTISPVANMTNPESSIYSYGNYYNWYTAVAGSMGFNDREGHAPHSICPRGWVLPAGSWDQDPSVLSYSDFYYMASAVSGETLDIVNNNPAWEEEPEVSIVLKALQKYPNNWIGSGGFTHNTNLNEIIAIYAEGLSWASSSISLSGKDAEVFIYDSISVDPAMGVSVGRHCGMPVRCFVDQ